MKGARLALRQKIKNTRRALTMEANHWAKLLDKCQAKRTLTNSARTHLKASAELTQETMMKRLAVITSALEDIIRISGNLQHGDMGTLEAWTAELVEEMTNQKEAVADTIEDLGDRTEPLLEEERKDPVGGG